MGAPSANDGDVKPRTSFVCHIAVNRVEGREIEKLGNTRIEDALIISTDAEEFNEPE